MHLLYKITSLFPEGPVWKLLLQDSSYLIVSLNKSGGFYAFVIVIPPPKPLIDFLCALYTPEFSSYLFIIQLI